MVSFVKLFLQPVKWVRTETENISFSYVLNDMNFSFCC